MPLVATTCDEKKYTWDMAIFLKLTCDIRTPHQRHHCRLLQEAIHYPCSPRRCTAGGGARRIHLGPCPHRAHPGYKGRRPASLNVARLLVGERGLRAAHPERHPLRHLSASRELLGRTATAPSVEQHPACGGLTLQ